MKLHVNWIKNTTEQRKRRSLGIIYMQDYKDRIGLQLIKFDFVTGCHEIKTVILVTF